MKKYVGLIMVLGLVLVTAIPATASDYGSVSKYGTKAYGMGGAFTAIADDASAIYWNPAGLTQASLVGWKTSVGGKADQDDLENIADFIDDVEGLANKSNVTNEDLENLKLPADTTANLNGIVAFNLSKFAVAGVFDNQFEFTGEKKNATGPEEGTIEYPIGTADNVLTGQGIVGWGTKLVDPPILGSLAVGINGKYLYARQDIAETTDGQGQDHVIHTEDDDNGLGADIGFLGTLTETDTLNVKAGASFKNIVNTMDMETAALQRTTTLGAGATFKFPVVSYFSARLAADLEMPEDGANIKRVGAEGRFGMLSLRAGAYDSSDMDEAVYTGGVGINLPLFDVEAVVDSEEYVSVSGTFSF
ncbi:MAG: hypothetical protein ACQERJ_08765 [Bacillota bacterium]